MGFIIKVRLYDIINEVSRTITIPDKISFKRLSDIIRIAFGWPKDGLHYFVFLDNKKIITNDLKMYQNRALCTSNLKIYRSQNILISKYLTKHNNFLYYWSGNNMVWEHEITLISNKENNNLSYPQIISFVGENVIDMTKDVAYHNEISYYINNNLDDFQNEELKRLIKNSRQNFNLNLTNLLLRDNFFRKTLRQKKENEI